MSPKILPGRPDPLGAATADARGTHAVVFAR